MYPISLLHLVVKLNLPTLTLSGTPAAPCDPDMLPDNWLAVLNIVVGDTSTTVVLPAALIGSSLTLPLAPVVACVIVSPLTAVTVPVNTIVVSAQVPKPAVCAAVAWMSIQSYISSCILILFSAKIKLALILLPKLLTLNALFVLIGLRESEA